MDVWLGLVLWSVLCGTGVQSTGGFGPPSVTYSFDGDILVHIENPWKRDHNHLGYIVMLWKNNSQEVEERIFIDSSFLLHNLTPGESYCFKVKAHDYIENEFSLFSPDHCLKIEAKGHNGQPYPENLRVEALNTDYMLKWDWNFADNPNVTFSVKTWRTAKKRKRKVNGGKQLRYNWAPKSGCENLTSAECNVSDTCIYAKCFFRVYAVFDGRKKTWSRALLFSPFEDAVIGPPSEVTVTLQGRLLQIRALEPEGFKTDALKGACNWVYSVILWKEAPNKQEMSFKENIGLVTIPDVLASTTYCLQVRVECRDSARRGLYSEVQCISTDADFPHLWIFVSTAVGMVITSLVIYICACPLKRYIKRTYYTIELSSIIEKSTVVPHVKLPFILPVEEPTDLCHVVWNIGDDKDPIEIEKYPEASKEPITDSGNYSNEEVIGGIL